MLKSFDDTKHCVMGLVVNSKDYFVFGDSFLRSYYQIYDTERSLFGLSPHITSHVGRISN